MSGGKKRVPRPVRSPLVTLAKSTPVGSDEAAEIVNHPALKGGAWSRKTTS